MSLHQIPVSAEEASAVEELRALAEVIEQLHDHDRYNALIDFGRRVPGLACLMLLDEAIGRVAREAFVAIERVLTKSSPQRSWCEAPASHGRESIARVTGVSRSAPVYATFPFRVLATDGGPRIAAPVRCPSIFASPHDPAPWLDIDDVILWDPRTNKAEIAGEGDGYIAPWCEGESLTVFADPAAFFATWAQGRAESAAYVQPDVGDHPDVPGLLVIGDLAKVPWPRFICSTLIAGPGVRQRDLQAAVIASAHLPRVIGGGH